MLMNVCLNANSNNTSLASILANKKNGNNSISHDGVYASFTSYSSQLFNCSTLCIIDFKHSIIVYYCVLYLSIHNKSLMDNLH